MKKILYIFLILALSVSVQAQVDRTVQPKAGPAPKVNLGKPQSFKLPNGLTVLVVENHKLPRVTFSLSLDNPPSVEGAIKGVDDIASSMMGNGTSKISKDEFNNKVDYYGASVYFNVHNVGASTLSRYFPDVLSLVAQGALDPLFTQDELDSERAKLIENIKTQEKSASAIASQARTILIYGANHPKGEYLSEATINKVTLADVNKYYKSYFVPQNAYLVVVGDVKFDDVKTLVTKNFSSWKKGIAPKSVYKEPANVAKTEINFVDVLHAVQSEISVNNVVNLKMADPDFFAVTLANHILGGGGGEGRLFLNLRETHGWTYGSHSSISGSKYTSDFSASVSVRNTVTDSAIVEILNEINKVRTSLPTQDELSLAKAKYIGNFVMNAEKPQTIASFALREKTQQLPASYYQDYIKNINAVTLEQVQAAAKKYFSHDNSRIVIAGKASDVLTNLEKLNIPINYFDKYGNPVAKPEAKTVDASVTPQSVFKKYIDAVGGEKALNDVQSIFVVMKTKVQGQELTISSKQTKDGKSVQETSMMGMVLAKAVFNGSTGYTSMQGQKKDMAQEEINQIKEESLFPELKLVSSSDVTIAGIEKINDADAYKVVAGKKVLFYDVNTGLKVAEDKTQNANGQEVVQRAYILDYTTVNGIKISSKMSMNMMGMDIEMNTSDIKINEGVSDADFE